MEEKMIESLQTKIAILETQIEQQKREISDLQNLIELIRADSPDQKEFD